MEDSGDGGGMAGDNGEDKKTVGDDAGVVGVAGDDEEAVVDEEIISTKGTAMIKECPRKYGSANTYVHKLQAKSCNHCR